MTDVWKSNARKFCEICKVWFADNKVSIEHHEGGRRHKEAIQAKLRELGRKSKEKEKEQAELEATLAAMQSAAERSMSRIKAEAAAANLPCAPVGPSLKPRTYMDPRAHGSSVAAMAQQLARIKKEREEAAKLASKSQHWKDDDEEELSKAEKTIEEEIVWAETNTGDGTPYYFHIYTGETVWEMPQKFYTAAEYAKRIASFESTNIDPMAPISQLPAARRDWGVKKEEPSSGDSSKVNRAQRRANHTGAPSKTAPVNSYVKSATTKYTAPCESATTIASTFQLGDLDIPLPPSPQASNVTVTEAKPEPNSIDETEDGIKKAKLEPSSSDETEDGIKKAKPEPSSSDETEDGINKAKPEPSSSDETEDGIKKEPESTTENGTDPATPASGSCIKTESDENIEQPSTESESLKNSPPQINRPSPYGEWKKVQKPVEEPKIDYELPTEEEGRRAKKEEQIRPEDIVEFTEKSAPILRKRPKNAPIEFKKRKVNMNAHRRADGE